MWIIVPLSWLTTAAIVVFCIAMVGSATLAEALLTAKGIVMFLVCGLFVAINAIAMFRSAQRSIKKHIPARVFTCAISSAADMYLFLPVVVIIFCELASFLSHTHDIFAFVLSFIGIIFDVLFIGIVITVPVGIWFFFTVSAFSSEELSSSLMIGAALVKLLIAFAFAAVMNIFISRYGSLFDQQFGGTFIEILVDSLPVII